MSKELVGLISGILVVISVVPYSIRTYQQKVHPNPTTWFLWTIIGLTLLLTYNSSGAGANVWPAIFGFTNPLLIFLLLLHNREKWEKMNGVEKICLVFGIAALLVWLFVKDSKNLSQYALYIAIIADGCAAIPTISFVWNHPDKDRPFAWILFGIGYGLVIFAISDYTFANYILPLYMFVGALFIALPLIMYRIKKSIPLKEWI